MVFIQFTVPSYSNNLYEQYFDSLRCVGEVVQYACASFVQFSTGHFDQIPKISRKSRQLLKNYLIHPVD